MKAPATFAWIPGLVVTMAGLPGGLAQQETNRPAPRASDPVPIVIPAPATTAPVFPAITADKEFPSLAKPPPDGDALGIKRQPPRMRLSPWTSEIVKLAESGIENGVILSFIENAGTFNLGADQIVYLNDLGLSGEIIAAMLRHDQEIISGLKPLAIASEPEWLAFDKPFTTGHDAPQKKSEPQSTHRDHSSPTPAPTEMPNTPGSGTLPEAGRAFSTIWHAILAEPAPSRPAGLSPPRQSSENKSGFYRVREPYPEEITAPIILIGESRTPNTMILVGFPRTPP